MAAKKESAQSLSARALKIAAVLKKIYPDAKCSLDFKTPFQLLVATILSAQCTDERVNKVTPRLFSLFPTPEAMSKASIESIEELIRTTGFFRNKAKSISETSKILAEKYSGKVPQTMDELVHLRGIGRKTANVVLGNAFEIPGLPVDTHVGRLSRRLGFTKSNDPVKIEHELMELLPANEWTVFSHLLIYHGRARCTARSPDCEGCEVAKLCPKIGV